MQNESSINFLKLLQWKCTCKKYRRDNNVSNAMCHCHNYSRSCLLEYFLLQENCVTNKKANQHYAITSFVIVGGLLYS